MAQDPQNLYAKYGQDNPMATSGMNLLDRSLLTRAGTGQVIEDAVASNVSDIDQYATDYAKGEYDTLYGQARGDTRGAAIQDLQSDLSAANTDTWDSLYNKNEAFDRINSMRKDDFGDKMEFDYQGLLNRGFEAPLSDAKALGQRLHSDRTDAGLGHHRKCGVDPGFAIQALPFPPELLAHLRDHTAEY